MEKKSTGIEKAMQSGLHRWPALPEHPDMRAPYSPKQEINGIPYFPRLCDKIRLMEAGQLEEEYHANLGGGMDLWTCQFLGVDYHDLAEVIRGGASDEEALRWAIEHGTSRTEEEAAWWCSYMRTRGFRDDLSQRLKERKQESGMADRDEIQTFMDYIDADEGRPVTA